MTTLPISNEERAPIKQVANSRKIVNETLTKALESITSIVQNNLAIEQSRSLSFKSTRKELTDSLNALNQNIAESQSRLDQAWSELFEVTSPLALSNELKSLKTRADEVLQNRRDFITSLENEITRRDHEYVNAMASQSTQIDNLTRMLRTSESEIRKLLNSELDAVLSAFEQERTSLSLLLTKESKQFEAKRQKSEQTLSKKIKKHSDRSLQQLEELRRANAQEYTLLRTSIETRLETYQKEYEDALAKYHFSLEQLDYETRILSDTQDEHEEKVKLQAKKMVRQRDVLRSLKKRYEDEDKKFVADNRQSTQEYAKITENYRQLQERFRKVAYADFNAFREVWNLNESRLHELVLKVIDADRLIMEQQLGKPAREVDPDFLKRKIIGTEDFEDLTKTPQKTVVTQVTNGIGKQKYSEPLEHLWRLISDEVGFLVEERVKGLIGDEELIRRDVLLQDLGITEPDDVEQLLSHFLRDTEFGELETPGFVRPHEVLEGLRRFVEAFHPTVDKNQANLFSQITSDPTQNTSSEVARAILQLQAKMRKQSEEQRRLIERKSEVVTEEMWRVWNAVYKALGRYVTELEERSKVLQEVESLRTQNEELERLVQGYMGADGLIYAPEETVDFRG